MALVYWEYIFDNAAQFNLIGPWSDFDYFKKKNIIELENIIYLLPGYFSSKLLAMVIP